MKPAIFSPDRRYRYTLWRQWNELMLSRAKYCMFICLNPSTADEKQDDPTMRRCMGFAKSWGMDAMLVTNLFAIRSTDPRIMLKHPEPVGDDNDHYIIESSIGAQFVIAAWGNHGSHKGRASQVCQMLRMFNRPVYCLGVTGSKQPNHPLYLPANTRRVSFSTCWRCGCPEIEGICQNYGCETSPSLMKP